MPSMSQEELLGEHKLNWYCYALLIKYDQLVGYYRHQALQGGGCESRTAESGAWGICSTENMHMVLNAFLRSLAVGVSALSVQLNTVSNRARSGLTSPAFLLTRLAFRTASKKNLTHKRSPEAARASFDEGKLEGAEGRREQETRQEWHEDLCMDSGQWPSHRQFPEWEMGSKNRELNEGVDEIVEALNTIEYIDGGIDGGWRRSWESTVTEATILELAIRRNTLPVDSIPSGAGVGTRRSTPPATPTTPMCLFSALRGS
ncbi:hypothetical protein B0H19DRAFT_1085726 [Mycena capillaripes]|nr:hypothetical protein B0H19DRAFT_1085726 [Mycena capillaripes]